MKKLLIAGPWIGEFGWELMGWQGAIRKLSRSHKKTIVMCPESSQYLYKDFAYDLWFVDKSFECSAHEGYDVPQHYYDDRIKEEIRGLDVSDFTIVAPSIFPKPSDNEFISFKQTTTKKYHIAFHARMVNRQHKNLSGANKRNWPKDKWMQLMEKMKDTNCTMCSIGYPGQALHLPYTDDLRSVQLKDTINTLNSSVMMAGPNSGPTHLSALCECPHLTWIDYSATASGMTTYERVSNVWNPFKTPVSIIQDLQPSPDFVFEQIGDFLQILLRNN